MPFCPPPPTHTHTAVNDVKGFSQEVEVNENSNTNQLTMSISGPLKLYLVLKSKFLILKFQSFLCSLLLNQQFTLFVLSAKQNGTQ